LKILHVELGRHLYGGARQVAYLLNGLAGRPGEHVLVTCEGAELIGAMVNPSVRVHALPFRGDADLGFVGRLRRVIRAERPDLVHVHSRRGDFLAALAGRLEGKPMIHSRRVDNPPRWIDTRVKFPLFERLVTISEGIREVLLKAGVPAGRVICVPSAVDTGAYRPGGDRSWLLDEFGLAEDSVVLGLIAQLIPRKGHDVLLEALPAVRARHPETRVLLFGRGPLEAELRAAVQTLGLDGAVRFAGFRTDLARVLPCLDLVVHPARMEGLGVSLLEAAACGVPLVASRAGGIPEIVHDGLNGRLVEPGDSEALAGALGELLDYPERRRAFGAAGRRLVLERFSVERMVAGNYGVYAAVASGSPLALGRGLG
jgi:glycosyltransferase involved in cell wall biosynthesis